VLSQTCALFDSEHDGVRKTDKIASHLFGGARFWFAASPSYVLVLHEFPSLFANNTFRRVRSDALQGRTCRRDR
jgi:hypothetical protein